ncbi:hypothetical protein ACA910_018117 [Epithemia clementina (nom. ined.)]
MRSRDQLQLQQQEYQLQQKRWFAVRARRNKPKFEKYPSSAAYEKTPDAYYMEKPYSPGSTEEDLDAYFKKASLSPWAPLPESAFRKYFDLAGVEPGDLHVDLGCGDGRINFHAVDNMQVERSIGIDVDEEILKLARERLARRHPPPKNLEFYVADLMDEKHEVWEKIQNATIITMFFASTALKRFRPVLEQKLIGKKCRVLTAGYEMPTWVPHVTEVVLGTQINLYKFGYEDEGEPLVIDDEMWEKAAERERLLPPPVETDERFKGMKIIDRTNEILTPEEDERRTKEAFEGEDDEIDFDDGDDDYDPSMYSTWRMRREEEKKMLKESKKYEQQQAHGSSSTTRLL